MTTVGDEAFMNSGLTSVTIQNGVVSIGEWAFMACPIESVTVPDSVTSLGSGAFRSTHLRTFALGNGITVIGDDTFAGCTVLTSVSLGNNVTSIGARAFQRCMDLRSIDVPGTVTSIGSGAFSECTSLAAVTIGNNVTAIGSTAFDGCTSLRTMAIPASVTSVGENAFRGCVSLTGIDVSADNTAYSSDGCGVLYNKGKTVLVAFPNIQSKEYIMPETVTSIAGDAWGPIDSTDTQLKVKRIVTGKNLTGAYELCFRMGKISFSTANAAATQGRACIFEFCKANDTAPGKVRESAGVYDVYHLSIDKDTVLSEPLKIQLFDKNVQNSMKYRHMYKIEDNGDISAVNEDRTDESAIYFFADKSGYYSMIERKAGVPHAAEISIGIAAAGTVAAIGALLIRRRS